VTVDSFATLANFSLRYRRAVLLAAGLLTVLAAVFGASATRFLSEGGTDAPSEQSSQAAAILQSQFHTGNYNFLLLVTAKHGTVNDPAAVQAGQALTSRLAHQRFVTNVESYWSLGDVAAMAGRSHTEAIIVGRILGDQNQIVAREPAVAAAFRDVPSSVGVQIGGFAPAFHEIGVLVERGLIIAELVAIPITFVLLLMIYGSVVAALLPVGIGSMAVVGTLLVLRLLAGFTTVSVFAENLTTALGLGLAIDYSLFMVTRFREELAAGHSGDEAVRLTVVSAGRTVAGSALTVAGALATLMVFPIPILRSFGYAGVAVALLAGLSALVVLPSLLGVLGSRVNAGAVWRRSISPRDVGMWSSIAHRVMRRPAVVAVAVIALLVLLAGPFMGLKLGSNDERILPPGNATRMVDQAVGSAMGVGQTQQIDVVVPSLYEPAGTLARTDVIDRYATQLSHLRGVHYVAASTGVFIGGLHLSAPPAYLSQFDNAKGTWLSVVPDNNTLDQKGRDLVAAIRQAPAPGAILVGGSTAEFVDSTGVISHDLPLVLFLIAAVSFLVLYRMFRSVVIALQALVLSALSLSAMFGAMVWIFQEGHLSGLLDFTAVGNLSATTPVLMFCVAFGLSMDYEVFLISRVKELHDAGVDTATAVALGLQRTGRIITAAALLISVVFLGQVLSGISSVKLFGLGVSLAVLMDAFVIRGLLVPAVMKLSGRANWWAPRRAVGPVTLPGPARPLRPAGAAIMTPSAPAGRVLDDRRGVGVMSW
jgi:RND superfamily putative drug exporter